MNKSKIPYQDYSLIVQAIGSNVKPNISDAIIKLLGISNESCLLELGCGTGGDANYIVQKTGASIVGVDVNEHVIKEASKYIPILNFDLSSSPYPVKPSSFDGVYFLNLLQLINNKNNLFKETFRSLRFGGKVFMLITNQDQIKQRFINKYFPSLVSIELKRHVFEKELIEALRNVGFSQIDIANIDFDECIINRNYLNRLKSGILSSLLLLEKEEREYGLELLENDIKKFELKGYFPKYKRIRTALIAHKR